MISFRVLFNASISLDQEWKSQYVTYLEFVLQAPDHIGDEIVEAPTNAVGLLLHIFTPLST